MQLDEECRVPADLLHNKEGLNDSWSFNSSIEVIHQYFEYADKSEIGTLNEDVVVLEESSAELNELDCETTVSTYSNLDSHAGKIEAPENTGRKRFSEIVSRPLSAINTVISIQGKVKISVKHLPCGKNLIWRGLKI